MPETILVLGGTGLLGAPVVERLSEDGRRVRLLARNPDKARERFGAAVEVMSGDATDRDTVKKALAGCEGVHLSLNGEAELIGTQHVAALAQVAGVDRITYVSGATAYEANRWFPMTAAKLDAEAAIRGSGVAWTVFCPTWPMEMLARYARNGQPFLIGDVFEPLHFYAAADLARMVSTAYTRDDAINKRFTIFGPEGITMPDALRRYCAAFHPDAGDIQIMPIEMAKNAAAQTGNKMLEFGAALMAYFEKVGEMGDPAEANRILGAPETTLDAWLERQMVQG